MTKTLLVFDPTPRLAQKSKQTPHMLKSIEGAVVGFIDNSKPNFDHLVDELSELLVSRYGVTKVLKYRKRVASMATPEATMKEFTDQCALVITGSGD